jgi:glyoxylase-like metal-dependent hydrolase (beta-lactamase superfamily II)
MLFHRLPLVVVSMGLFSMASRVLAENDRKVTTLADGVYEIQHAANGGGNTTVIIGDRQVFVVDTGFLPSAAREDIAQIRHWTNKPVSFVLNTHFHNDHNLGNRAYMDAFPGLTIIAHAETKKDMDRFGPGSESREEKSMTQLQQMLASGKTTAGAALTDDDKKAVKNAITSQEAVIGELKNVNFQSATLTFEHDFWIDLGNRRVQVLFLGRGNTAGDALVYLPKEKIVVAGDLVVYPIPYIYDGYPSEWTQTLQRLSQMDAATFVPGHGPILHDTSYILLIRDLLKSAVDQMNAELQRTGPAMFKSLDEVKGSVDLSPFRQRFTGSDRGLDEEFDDMAANLTKVVFEEATLR